MSAEREAEPKIDPSLPPEHFLLVCLDLARGKPLTVEELIRRFSARLTESIAAGNSLSKYVDPEDVVLGSLSYAESLKLIETVPEVEPNSVRITALGSFMAIGLQPSPQDSED